jgi:hypothetical protein
MSRTRRILTAPLLVTSLLLVPGVGSAACPKVFVISGVSGPVTNPGTGHPVREGVNAGAVGARCTSIDVPPNHIGVQQPTFVLTPGATHAWAGILQSDSNAAPSGTMSVFVGASSTTTTLTFRLNTLERPDPLSARWESQSVPLPVGVTRVSVSSSVGSVTYGNTP